MDIKEFKNLFFDKAKKEGITECELFYLKSDSTHINMYKQKLERYDSSSQSGAGIRGIYNGKMGYCSSESISADVIDTLVNDLKQNAGIITGDDKSFIYGGDSEYPTVDVYNPKISDISVDSLISAALDMEKAAYDTDKRVTGVNTSSIAKGESEVYIANTKGLELYEKSNSFFAYCAVMAEENGNTKENGDFFIGNDFDAFKPADLGRSAAQKTLESLGAKSVESGAKRVVVKNEVMADILGCFCGCFFADSVQKGFSMLKGKLNEKIAADIITIADEPLLKGGYSTSSFDSEGVACYNKNIIENGVLKTFLYNLKSAGADGVKSTGNGFKSSYKSTVGTKPTNMYIKKGGTDFEDMLKQLGSGIVITEVQGLHAGANPVTGDFSLAAEGFAVEDGKIAYPVEQITAAGNFFNMLKEIKLVGSDLKFNMSGIGSPSVLLENMAVSGL